jgi:hypothetical protein
MQRTLESSLQFERIKSRSHSFTHSLQACVEVEAPSPPPPPLPLLFNSALLPKGLIPSADLGNCAHNPMGYDATANFEIGSEFNIV